MMAQMNAEIELAETPKKRKTVKEQNKELRESRNKKPNPMSFSERYEEDLKRELFKNENPGDETENDFGYDGEDDKFIHIKRDGLWDVLADEEVKYFDPDLSYEITGYRPINEVEGLDFDPAPFCEAGKIFDETGSYCEYPVGYKPYNDYWREQIKRCVEGYTVGNYRVTGDHYFFLNFYRMQTVPEGIAGKGRNEAFPSFHAKQYEFFHYIDLCEAIKKDAILLKARGLGFSEMMASLGVRPYITTRKFRSLYTCAAEGKLTPLLNKCWFQMDWLNKNTNGGMKRLRQAINNNMHKRASRLTKDRVEFGRYSEVQGIIADTSDKIRGDRVDRLFFEEGGSNKNLIQSWIKSNALVELGGNKWAIRLVGGTGGDQGAELEGLSKMFSNPESYNALPYKNVDTDDGKVQYTGFFIPAHRFSLVRKYLDNRGVTLSTEFKEFYISQRKKMSGTDLLDYCAEHCFTPTEALIKQGENMFDSVAIADRLTQIRIFKEGLKPIPTALTWDESKEAGWNKVKSSELPSSKLLVYEPPQRDQDGNVFKNLYVAGVDSIDQGTDDSATQRDVSDFCIVIKKRVFGLNEPKYVAIYKDRPKDIREAYTIAMKLLTWYNCKALVEHTKISIITFFKEYKKDWMFMRRPASTMGDMKKGNSQMIGIPATETIIKHGLELINNFINDYCYSMDIDDMLEQLLKYSYDAKRKFDIVAAMGVCEIADEDMLGRMPKNESETKVWQDIGYYTDENGIKRYGIIPTKRPYNYGFAW